MQGLLGVVLLMSALRRGLSSWLRDFNLDPSRFRKVFMLPLVMAPCLFAYRVIVLDTKKNSSLISVRFLKEVLLSGLVFFC